MESEQNQKSSPEICGVCWLGVLLEYPRFFGETKGVMKMAEEGFQREKEHKLILYLEVKVGFDKMGSIRGEKTLLPSLFSPTASSSLIHIHIIINEII